MNELLPAGSVVSLNGSKGIYLMITGFYPADSRTKECYQYLGAAYPGGTTEKNGSMFMFNHKDINKVVFEGYSTDASKKALKQLTEHTEKLFSEETGGEQPQEENLFF